MSAQSSKCAGGPVMRTNAQIQARPAQSASAQNLTARKSVRTAYTKCETCLPQERELEDEARIAEYNRVKALRDAAAHEEKDRVAAEKEREVARLRAAQEKAADKQSELDELRARRHAETAEREWRAREAAKAAREKVRGLCWLRAAGSASPAWSAAGF
jgi:hypothetical protein